MSDRRTFLETIKEIASSIKKLLEAVNEVHAVRRAICSSRRNERIVSGRPAGGTKLSGEAQKRVRTLLEAFQQHSQRVLQGRRCQAGRKRLYLSRSKHALLRYTSPPTSSSSIQRSSYAQCARRRECDNANVPCVLSVIALVQSTYTSCEAFNNDHLPPSCTKNSNKVVL